MKRSGVRRGRPKPKPPMVGFWRAVVEGASGQCAICGDCRGWSMDAHHYIAKRHLPDEAKVDPANGVCLCRPCHERVENARIECPRPPLLDQFLEDHQLLESGRPVPKGRAA